MQHGDSDGERAVAGAAAPASGGAAADDLHAVDGDEHAAAAPGTAESRNNKQFKADAFAAFDSMGLHANSRIPQAQVLARSPDVDTNRDKCPRLLWEMIQKHGGYFEKGFKGVTRTRILTQHRLWRTIKFNPQQSTAGAAEKPAITKESMLVVLDDVVPNAILLVAEAEALHEASSSIVANRGNATTAVRVWGGDGCFLFWEATRSKIIGIVADAACDHPKDSLYISKQTRTGDSYQSLRAILTGANAYFTANCISCPARGAKACDCIAMVAWEAVDMYTAVVLRHVGDTSATATGAFVSPPEHAVLPIGSVDALYNIAGALLFKVLKLTQYNARGVSEEEQASCAAFFATHALTEAAARAAELPIHKVVRTQYSVNSLTFVSESLYNFFARVELVYWTNLHVSAARAGVLEAIGALETFARADTHVRAAWDVCMRDIVDKHNTGHAAADITELMNEATVRSQKIFNLLTKTYKNVRGKEYATTYADATRRAGDVRTSSTRDQQAAILAFHSSSGGGGGGKK